MSRNNRNAGPVKCNALFALHALLGRPTAKFKATVLELMVRLQVWETCHQVSV